MTAARSLRAAFFGRPDEALSVVGLQTLLRQESVAVETVTVAREGPPPDGRTTRLAGANGVPLVPFGELKAAPAPDFVLSFSNNIIFPDDYLARVPYGVVNLHPAPLPDYRWSHGIEHCLLNGDPTFGVTLHFCDAGIDTGPIIEVARFPVGSEDNSRTLWTQVDRVAEELLRRHLPRLVEAGLDGRRLPARAQPPGEGRAYPSGSLPVDVELDPANPWEVTVRQIRAWDHPRREPAALRWGGTSLRMGWRGGAAVVLKAEPA